jgi:hypothetical protein
VSTLIRGLASAGRFLYGFVVGDDWTVALVIALGLATTAVMAANGLNAWWLVPLLAVGMTVVSVRRRTHD